MQEIICNLTKKFGFNLIKNIPFKDHHIVVTNISTFSLKKIDCEAWEILFIHNAKEYLINNGFDSIDRYITAHGIPYVEVGKECYVMTRLIKGRQYSFINLTDVHNGSKALANLHQASKGYYYEIKNKVRSNIGKLQEQYLERCQDFIYIKSLVKMKKKKEKIDILFLEYVDMLHDMAMESVLMLQNNGYFEICEETSRENYLCHNAYNRNNIVIDKYGKLNIINFDYCKFELRCVDIANFILDAMNRLNWDFESALKILDAYNDVRQIEEREYKLMISLLQFPEEIWELVTEYYYQEHDGFKIRYYIELKNRIEKIPYKIDFLKKYKERFL